MNDSYKSILESVYDMQVPIITVEYLDERLWPNKDMTYRTNHIIIPEGKDKVLDFTFARNGKDGYILVTIKTLEMSFKEAIVMYSNMVLGDLGAQFHIVSL